MNKIEINIDNYLSEEDKKEIAIEEFRRIVRENTLEEFKRESKLTNKKGMSDYERIISNSIFYYLEGEIDSLIGQDTKKLIREGVEKTIKKQDYNYSLFRRKNAWESEESPALKVVIECIRENTDYIKSKLMSKIDENINNLDNEDVLDTVREIFYEIIEEKLKK